LLEKRKELHGKRRRLHEQLSEVCEAFVLEKAYLWITGEALKVVEGQTPERTADGTDPTPGRD
jgi:hypothetical protein